MRYMSNRDMIERLAGMVETQNKIIKLYSKGLNTLFALLHQYISATELDNLPVMDDINAAAKLRREMEEL